MWGAQWWQTHASHLVAGGGMVRAAPQGDPQRVGARAAVPAAVLGGRDALPVHPHRLRNGLPCHGQQEGCGSQSRTRGHITKSNYGVAPKHRDLTETLEWRRPSRRLRLARWSEPASVPFSRNALYYLSQEKRGSATCLKSKLEELEGHEASSSKGRMRAQRRAPGNLLGLRGAIRRSCTNIKNEQI